jgi:hypothetical protein
MQVMVNAKTGKAKEYNVGKVFAFKGSFNNLVQVPLNGSKGGREVLQLDAHAIDRIIKALHSVGALDDYLNGLE